MIGEDGRMTEAAGEPFAGMTVLEAREAVVERAARGGPDRAHRALRARRAATPSARASGSSRSSRCSGSCAWTNSPRPAIEVVRDGRVTIHPEGQRRRYVEWMENIRPWCISRQLWWGHQIPVWYRGDEIYVGVEPPEGDGWERDPDVLDTWFSSALWPFADARLARRHAGAARVLPDRRALDRAGHPVPVGRPDGHVRPGVRAATSRSPTSTCTRSSRRRTGAG